MQKLTVKIPRAKQRIKIIRSRDLIQFELNEIEQHRNFREELKKRLQEEQRQRQIEAARIAEENRIEEEQRRAEEEELRRNPPRTRVYHEYWLPNTFGPVELKVDNIPEEALPLSIVALEVQKSYDKGLRDGQISAKANFQTEIDQYQNWVNQIENVAESLKIEHRRAIARFEETLIPLATMIAEHIIEREVIQNKDFVLQQVKKAINLVEGDTIFKICVNPENIEILEETKSNLVGGLAEKDEIVLVADKSIPVGGCVLETSAGLIDSKISTQLQIMKQALTIEAQKPISSEDTEKALDKLYSDSHSPFQDATRIEFEEVQADDQWTEDDMPEEYRRMLEDDGSIDLGKNAELLKSQVITPVEDIDIGDPESDDFLKEMEEFKKMQEMEQDIEDDGFVEDSDNFTKSKGKQNGFDDDLYNDLMNL